MSSILNEFNIFKDIKLKDRINVICFHIFNDIELKGRNAFIVTKNGLVYGIGPNSQGQLGLGHNQPVEFKELINELSELKIEQFFVEKFIFAKTTDNQIYSWGTNYCGNLARGFASNLDQFFKPVRIEFFQDKNIIQISSGLRHCLALSADGQVYQWGDTYKVQAETVKQLEVITIPVKWNLDFKIKSIISYFTASIAIAFNGQVYVWKDNTGLVGLFQGQRTLSLLSINNVAQVAVDDIFTKYFLKDDGTLCKMGGFNSTKMEKIITKQKIKEIHSVGFQLLCQTDECVYYIPLGKNELTKSNYINFFDAYLKEFNTTKQTIHITKDGFLMEKNIEFNDEFEGEICDNFIYSSEDKLENFNIIKTIGYGGFGKVLLAEKYESSIIKNYAIKKIWIEPSGDKNQYFREIRLLSELNADFVVNLITSWTEDLEFLYIQMEFCANTLSKLIDSKPESFKRKKNEVMTALEYNISLEIFKELTECLIYIHSFEKINLTLNSMRGLLFVEDRAPTIIKPLAHRDIKPDNILVTNGINSRFIKLCDFGLSNYIEQLDDNPGVGTRGYLAPEVWEGIYSNKSDVYNLAIIAEELFELDLNGDTKVTNNRHLYSNTNLEPSFEVIIELLIKMKDNDYNRRPNCEEVLHCIEKLLSSNVQEQIEGNITPDDFYKEFIEMKFWSKCYLVNINPDIFSLEIPATKKSIFNVPEEKDHSDLKEQNEVDKIIGKMNVGRVLDCSGIEKNFTDNMENIFGQFKSLNSFFEFEYSIQNFDEPYERFYTDNFKMVLKFIYNCFDVDENGLFYDSFKIHTILDSFSYIGNMRRIIRKLNPLSPDQIFEIGPDAISESIIMAKFLEYYTPYKSSPNQSSFYSSLSLLFFNSLKFSDLIRLMTFEVYFKLRKELIEYCEQIGENYRTTLFKIILNDESTKEAEDKFNIQDLNQINCSTLIATHILIVKPIFIYEGVIDEKDWVETIQEKIPIQYQSNEEIIKIFKCINNNEGNSIA